jgi:hypothetical protein
MTDKGIFATWRRFNGELLVSPPTQAQWPFALLLRDCYWRRSQRKRGTPVKLLRPITVSLLLSIILLASTARWAAANPLRKEWTHATQQKQVNELDQREQLDNLNRTLELNQTQRQLDQLRNLAGSRPDLAAQPRAQQLNETQKQLDQLQLEQQLNRVQHELNMNQIEREHNSFRRQEQIRELQLQQQMQFLQDQSRTKLMQQDLNRLR